MDKWFKIIAWLANIALWVLCLAPISLQLPAPITRVDLFYHALTYTLVTLAFLMAYSEKRIHIAIGLIAQGILIEFVQPYTGRFFEFYDMIANTTGVAFALILWLSFLEKLKLTIFKKLNLSR